MHTPLWREEAHFWKVKKIDTFLQSNYYIIRVALNTQFDTACLSGWHTQMAHFGVYPLVCPFSIWPRQGFYVELFSINAFAPEHQAKMKRTFGLE